METKKGKKREAPISYRPPAALRDDFHARVERSGLTISGFITRAVFGTEPGRAARRPAIEEKMLAKLLTEAAAIRQLFQDIEAPGEKENSQEIERAVQCLEDIRAAIFTSLRRKP
ncbi:hypothetical protein [Haliea atlantica]